MIIVSTPGVDGVKIKETIGVVRGSSVRAKWFGKDIMAGLRNIVGGELKEYKELLEEARESAGSEMISDARKLGADAVVNVRFMTSQISQGASEILVYGTAVKLKNAK